jgi:hypothetical protein
MDAHVYSLKQKHGEWIVCVDGQEMLVCADKGAALELILVAAEASEKASDLKTWQTLSAQHANQRS